MNDGRQPVVNGALGTVGPFSRGTVERAANFIQARKKVTSRPWQKCGAVKMGQAAIFASAPPIRAGDFIRARKKVTVPEGELSG